MNLKGLRYFLKAAETGSFLETARAFNTPASSVSRYISALEQDLGHQLFYRSTRAIRLTEEGARFRLQASEALELLDNAVNEIARRDEQIHGQLSINAPEALGRLHVAGILNKLQERYPNLSVDLTLTDTYIDPVREGADITIRVGPLIDSGLIGKVIATQHYILAASPDYLDKYGTPTQPSDLLKHNCLLYRGVRGTQKWFFRSDLEQAFKQYDISGTLRSNNSETLVSAALAARGIVLLPTWMFLPESFAQHQLSIIMPEWHISATAQESFIQILSPENRLRSRKVREVSNFFVKEFGTPPYWDQGFC